MTEFSGLWTTDGASPVGDQQTSYTQAQLSIFSKVIASCYKFEGIAPGYLNKLIGTVGGANTFNIDTGGAIVDGKFYENDSSSPVTIPSAVGGGNTRIDRIVLRADWVNFTVRIYRISGTDAASPTIPSITQSSGTTYDIMLYQIKIDTGGTITIEADEREWATGEVDGTTIETIDGKLRVKQSGITANEIAADAVNASEIAANAVGSSEIATNAVGSSEIAADAVGTSEIADTAVTGAKIADNTITDDNMGDRVIKFSKRQGGNSSIWETGGTTNYTLGEISMQGGAIQLNFSSANTQTASITFPDAYAESPLVFITPHTPSGAAPRYTVRIYSVTNSGFYIIAENISGSPYTGPLVINWFAVGE